MSDFVVVRTPQEFQSQFGSGSLRATTQCFNFFQNLHDFSVRTRSGVLGAILFKDTSSLVVFSSGWALDKSSASKIYENLRPSSLNSSTRNYFHFVASKTTTSFAGPNKAREAFRTRTKTLHSLVEDIGSRCSVAWCARLALASASLADGGGAVPGEQWNRAAWEELAASGFR